MNIKFIFTTVLFCIALLFASCSNFNEDFSEDTEELSIEEKLNQVVKSYVNKWNYKPALSVSVFSKEKQIDFNCASGFASISGNVQNEIYTQHFIYSITKSFVAASIIKLSNEQKLSLEDPLSYYVQNTNRIYVNETATIKELLSHRSGISDYTGSSSIIYNNPFSKSDEWKPQSILNFIETPAINRGEFIYSSANYILLGMVLENVTGIKANEYIKNNFVVPLALSASVYPQDSVELSKVAHPHCYPNTFMDLAGDGETPIDVTDVIHNSLELLGKCAWTAGGIITNAENISKWGYELLSKNGSVEKSIRSEILNSVSEFKDKSAESTAYGYGIRKLFYGDFELVGSYGRSVGDENLMFYNSDKDICIAILSSSNMKKDKTPNIDELMYEIFECF